MIPLHCHHITCRKPSWNERPHRAIEDFSGSFEEGTTTAFQETEDGGTGLLLGILGIIEPPDSGQINVLDQAVLEMEATAAHRLRDATFGYFFTHPHLLPSFTAAENIAMPYLRLCGSSLESARERVAEVLILADLDVSCANMAIADLDEASHWRIAFARSIVHSPKILVAVSPPAPFLLPLARRYAQKNGATVLWNAGAGDVTGQCDRILAPHRKTISIAAG